MSKNKQQKKESRILAGLIGVAVFILAFSGNVRDRIFGGLTPEDLAKMYYDMLHVGSVDALVTVSGDTLPRFIYLAQNTRNYDAVKAAYMKFYGKNLTTDLLWRFNGEQLSLYVAELLDANNQVMTP